MKTTLASAAAIAAFSLASVPVPAAAQAWIGQIAGEAVAREERARLEQACFSGVPASAQASRSARSASDRLLLSYFYLTSGSSPQDVQRVFADRKEVTWADTGGVVPISTLGARLDGPTPVLAASDFIVAGDGESARGIWTAKTSGQLVGYYAVNFVRVGAFWNAGPWRIQHMSVYPADMRPATPSAYCHLDSSHVWPVPRHFEARPPVTSPAP